MVARGKNDSYTQKYYRNIVCRSFLTCHCSWYMYVFDSSKAWEHKERLLRFDREFARRTVVLDDQADFFASNKSWLTEEERIAAEEKHRVHKDKLITREKQKLDITF